LKSSPPVALDLDAQLRQVEEDRAGHEADGQHGAEAGVRG